MKRIAHLSAAERNAIDLFEGEVHNICKSQRCEIRLFGSRARQEGNEESDLDVLVLLDKLEDPVKVNIWDAAYRIFSATDILLSPLVLSRQQYEGLKKRERLIAINIEKEGIVIESS